MAELPYVKPTDDIAWGTSQVNEDDPLGAQKATGWTLNQLVPADWWNWLWYRITLQALWSRSATVRKFDRLDGSNGPLGSAFPTATGDRFTYLPVARGNLRQAVVQKGALANSGITLAMATDGLNLWIAYVSGATTIVQARDLDDETANGTSLALSTFSWTDGVLAMDADGEIVALAADTSGAGHNIIVYSAASGSAEFSGTLGAGTAYSVVADSSSYQGQRAWLVVWNAGSGSAIYMWSLENGASGALFTSTGQPAWDICVSPDAVFVIHGDVSVADTYQVRALKKDVNGDITSGGVELYDGTTGVGSKHVDVGARICTDGVRVYCVVGRRVGAGATERGVIFALHADTTSHDPVAVGPSPTNATPLWSVDDTLAAEDMGSTWHLKMRIAVDERFVYVIAGEVMVWLDKIDGAVVRRETVTGDNWSFALAVSGERVYQGGLEGAGTPYSGVFSYSKAPPAGSFEVVNTEPSETPGAPPDPSERRTRRGYVMIGEGRP